jgi:hypothetical protein
VFYIPGNGRFELLFCPGHGPHLGHITLGHLPICLMLRHVMSCQMSLTRHSLSFFGHLTPPQLTSLQPTSPQFTSRHLTPPHLTTPRLTSPRLTWAILETAPECVTSCRNGFGENKERRRRATIHLPSQLLPIRGIGSGGYRGSMHPPVPKHAMPLTLFICTGTADTATLWPSY